MNSRLKPVPNAVLLLADGTVFFGHGIGAPGATSGELCFNTAMTGYQEILTDPSYTGQIVTFTAPHIGNVGCNAEDNESQDSGFRIQDLEKPHASLNPDPERGRERRSQSRILTTACGLILREAITAPSNYRATEPLNDWLVRRGVTGISGVDTRALTLHLRENGAQNGAIVFEVSGLGVVPPSKEELLKKALRALAQAPDMDGLELAAHVTTPERYEWTQARWEEAGDRPLATPSIVAIDYGIKHNILRSLVSAGCHVKVLPATATAEEVLALNPDGVFLSNGPGDPAATAHYALPTIKKILASNKPMFGICLGHQLLGLALGARTEKMPQGHRGANHPVKDLTTGKVEITSQNHGFAISDTGLPASVEVTHRSLFDGTVQGIRSLEYPAFSVQGHPEASPGPQDSQYLFARFIEMVASAKHAA